MIGALKVLQDMEAAQCPPNKGPYRLYSSRDRYSVELLSLLLFVSFALFVSFSLTTLNPVIPL